MSNAAAAATAPRALVVGHGDFAAGMRSAVDRITGRGAELLPMSGQGLSLPQLEEAIGAALGVGIVVVFTDMQAGSATMAARRAIRDRPAVVLVSGANLPMLLDYVLNADGDAVAAARRAADRGRAAIRVDGAGGTA